MTENEEVLIYFLHKLLFPKARESELFEIIFEIYINLSSLHRLGPGQLPYILVIMVQEFLSRSGDSPSLDLLRLQLRSLVVLHFKKKSNHIRRKDLVHLRGLLFQVMLLQGIYQGQHMLGTRHLLCQSRMKVLKWNPT